MNPNDTRDTLLDTAAAAERLGVSPRTLEKWRQEGKGPAYVRLGSKKVSYRDAALDTFVTRGTVDPSGAAA